MNADLHIARFTLERVIADDLGETELNEANRHIESCGDCREELEALREDQEAFRREIPYAAFRIEHERRRAAKEAKPAWLRLWLPSLATVAAAAGILLMVAIPTENEDGLRLKGNGTAVTFTVLEGLSLRLGVPGEKLPAGTRLQLSYDAGDFEFMAVFGIDAGGTISRYFPDRGERMAPRPAGAQGPLPFSLTLDDTPGAERIYAIFAKTAEPLATLTQALGQVAGADPMGLGPLTLPAELHQSNTWIQKQ